MKKTKLTIIGVLLLCVFFVNACRKDVEDYTRENTVENQSIEYDETIYATEEEKVSEEVLKAREELLTEVGVFDDSSSEEDEKNETNRKNKNVEKSESKLVDNEVIDSEEDKNNNILPELSDVPSGF